MRGASAHGGKSECNSGFWCGVFPGAIGGGNWAYDSFSPDTGYVYVGYSLVDTSYSNARGGRVNTARPLGEYMSGGLAAVDPRTNTVAWRRPNRWWLSIGTGILSTAGRLLFQGRPDGRRPDRAVPFASSAPSNR